MQFSRQTTCHLPFCVYDRQTGGEVSSGSLTIISVIVIIGEQETAKPAWVQATSFVAGSGLLPNAVTPVCGLGVGKGGAWLGGGRRWCWIGDSGRKSRGRWH
jgi:hypothetical protein